MKNLGSFDPKAVDLFEVNFSENLKFSENTESYDFTRCQRPDGSVYGTSGQCRKGKEAGAGGDVESMKKKRQEIAGKIVDAALKQDMETMKKLQSEGLALDKQIIAAGGKMEGRVREQKNRGREKAQLGAKRAKAAADRANKGGEAPKTKAEAGAIRRAAVVNALKEAKLPTGPTNYKSTLNKRLKGASGFAEAQSNRMALGKELEAAQKEAKKATAVIEKKGGANATPEERKAYREAQKKANEVNTRYERARGEEARIQRKVQSQLDKEMRDVTAKAIAKARANEPIVGSDMGSPRRLGDGEITTSPRD